MKLSKQLLLTNPKLADHREFWGSQLEQRSEVEQYIPTRIADNGEVSAVAYDLKNAAVANQLGKQQPLGIFVVLNAALGLALTKAAGTKNVQIDIPMLNSHIEDGFADQQLPLIFSTDKCTDVRSWLTAVKESITKAINYQNFPVDEFAAAHGMNAGSWKAGVAITSDALHNTVDGQYDLLISISNDGTKLIFTSKTKRVGAKAAEMIASLTDTYLGQLVNLESPLSDLKNLTQAESEKVRQMGWAKAAAHAPKQLMHELFDATANQYPDTVAVDDLSKTATYIELSKKSNQLAHFFIDQYKIEQGDIIAVVTDRSVDLVTGMLAILKSGGIYLPVDPSWPKARIEQVLQAASPKALLVHSNYFNKLTAFVEIPMFALDFQLAVLDTPETAPAVKVATDAAAYLIYTSGTTGTPKGVVNTHQGFTNMSLEQSEIMLCLHGDNVLQFASAGFDASISEMFMAFAVGATVVMDNKELKQDTTKFLQFLHDKSIAVATLPPSYLKELNQQPLPFKSLITAGEAPVEEDIAFYSSKLKYVNAYGPTENAVCSSTCVLSPSDAKHPSIGTAIRGTAMHIVDEYMNLLPPYMVGELVVEGEGIAKEYLNDTEKTAEKFSADGISEGHRQYKTGDLAYMDADGKFYFKGRSDHQLKIRGNRVELGDIEHHIQSLEQVNMAVVIADQSVAASTTLTAFYTAKQEVSGTEVLDFLRQQLPEYMWPQFFVQVDQMPLTPNGKIDREELTNIQAKQKAGQDFIEPKSDLEEEISAIWKEVLELDQIGTDQNFFEIGGHSLKAIRITSWLNEKYGVQLNQRTLFSYPTIAELAEAVEDAEEVDTWTIPPAPYSEHYPLTNAQKRLWVYEQFDGESAAFNMPVNAKLHGFLEIEAFKTAFQALLKRHSSLRTTFKIVGDEPRQLIRTAEEMDFQIEVLDYANELDPLEKARAEALKEAMQSFDVLNDNLLRAKLLRIKPDLHIFLFTVHHLIGDGWSMRVLVNDVMRFYRNELETQPTPLPKLEIQFVDYAVWEQSKEAAKILQEQEAFWLRYLEGELEPVRVPTDYDRPEVLSFEGESIVFDLDQQLSEAVKNCCQKHGVTPFMFFQAAVNVLLHKYTGQEDIIIGSPVAGREHRILEPMIGYFLNTIALRHQVQPEATTAQLLSQVKGNTLDAYENQSYPFDKLVEQLDFERDPSRSPLFDVAVIMQNIELVSSDVQEFEQLQIEAFDVDFKISKSDLRFQFFEEEQTIKADIQYNTNLFSPDTMDAYRKDLLHVIERMCNDTQAPISNIELESGVEEVSNMDDIMNAMMQ